MMDGFNEFLENVSKAVIKLQECNVRANLITLDEKKFGKLKMLNMKGLDPTIFGLKVEYANLPDDIDFIVQKRHMWKIPQTNADRIRAMTDEELAVFLSQTEEHLFTGNLWSIKTWNEWLKKEVDDGEET